MKKLWYDLRGAVTIIVSIMLIPAILLSGTAVDLARIYSARSVAQNANQLMGNTVLTQYDALLKDLYGLFGVAREDEVLGKMVNDYIQLSIFGEKENDRWIATGLGTFQNYNGSTASGRVTAVDPYNLKNIDIMRRQIEEYMKFRGPVILVEYLFDALSVQGESLKASNAAIEQQKKVDEGVGKLISLYGDLYEAIQNADKCTDKDQTPWKAVDKVSDVFEKIKVAFGELKSRYDTVDSVRGHLKNQTPGSSSYEMYESWLKECEIRYYAKFNHIRALIEGGSWKDWEIKGRVSAPAWEEGNYVTSGTFESLQKIKDDQKKVADGFKSKFQDVVNIAKKIDKQRDSIRADVKTLQQKIDDPNCDPDIKAALQDVVNDVTKLLDKYPNIEGMANPYQTEGNKYIESVKTTIENMNDYYDHNNANKGKLSKDYLSNIASNPQKSIFALDENVNANDSKAKYYADFVNVRYSLPSGFKSFGNIKGNDGLYQDLKKMAAGSAEFTPESIGDLKDKSGSKDPEKRQRNIIEQLQTLAEEARDGLLNNPEGAEIIVDDIAYEGSWNAPTVGNNIIELISSPGNAIQKMADWVLMMTYDVSMFSNYTTRKPAQLSKGGKTEETPYAVSLTNIPIDPKVNYFYQSEWEYLLVGNKNADINLSAVKDLIYMIRLICNTIVSFKIKDVNTVANIVKTACSAIPFIGPALGVVMYFLVHVAFAAAESAYDLTRLRNGHKVQLIKDQGEWKCQLSEIFTILENLSDGDISETVEEHNKEKGISYEQYMLLFFLISSSIDTLAERTGNLIEWNVINYQSHACAANMENGKVKTKEAAKAMSNAFGKENCFRLEKRYTDFNVTTTVNLRLFFLSMPFFQQQGARNWFSNEIPIMATDYRGY